jgi:hypothetical protein
MSTFLLQNSAAVSMPVGLLIGLGVCWIYMGFRLRRTHRFWYRLLFVGSVFTLVGLLCFSSMILLNSRVSGTALNKWTLIFSVIVVLDSLFFAALSLFLYIKGEQKKRE